MANQSDILDEARASLKRVRDFKVDGMHREDELGSAYSFRSAIEPTQRVLRLFNLVRETTLTELPPAELQTLKTQADGFYKILQSVEEFDHTLPENTPAQRDSIVSTIKKQHQSIFTQLMPIISFLDIRGTDFASLETEARAAVQQAKDEAKTAKDEVEAFASQADEVLQSMQAAAAELGVSQEALKFKEEANQHSDDAKRWGKYTTCLAGALGVYAVASLFLHKWEVLAPVNTYDAIQLGLSKFLIFGVLTYMLFLSARNFLAHKHNAVLNRHRQSALVTFKALVDAGRIDEKQDIVLTHAAECIYGNRDTGFTRSGPQQASGSAAIVQMIPRSVTSTGSISD